jgi:hypothetical protein
MPALLFMARKMEIRNKDISEKQKGAAQICPLHEGNTELNKLKDNDCFMPSG